MEHKENKKDVYDEPKIIASYTKEELEETIKPHGQNDRYINNFHNNED
jgi:hypothetical protein